MSTAYLRYPPTGVPVYPSATNFPPSSYNGALAVAADTGALYEFRTGTMTWVPLADPAASPLAIDALTGDVSATGPGVVPATVNSVGGASAASIAAAAAAVAAGDFLKVNGTNSPTANMNWNGFNLLHVPVVQGDTAASGSLSLSSTSNATKGPVYVSDGSALLTGDSAIAQWTHFGSSVANLSAINIASSTNNGGIYMEQASNTAASRNGLTMGRARGTYTSPSFLLSGDRIASFLAYTYDGTNIAVGTNLSGRLRWVASENHSSSVCGANMEVSSVVNGTNVLTEAFRLDGATGNFIMSRTNISLNWLTEGTGSIGQGTGDGPTYAGSNRPSAVYVRDSLVVGDSAININEDGWISSGNDTNSIAYLGSDGGVAQFGFQNTGPFPLTGFQNTGTPGELRIFSDNPTVSLLWDVDGSGDIGADGDNRPENINFAGSLRGGYVPVSTDHTQTGTDYIIAVTDATAPRTITLINTVPAGTILYIKDESGAAVTNNITITGVNIDGMASAVITQSYGVIRLYFNGTVYFSL